MDKGVKRLVRVRYKDSGIIELMPECVAVLLEKSGAVIRVSETTTRHASGEVR